jgi:hypothetical protein
MTGPAIEAMPATTPLMSQLIEKNTDAYWVETEPSW